MSQFYHSVQAEFCAKFRFRFSFIEIVARKLKIKRLNKQ